MSDMTMSELLQIAQEQEAKGMTLGNAFKSLLKSAVEPIKNIPDMISDKALKIIHYHDDNVAVPAGTKTLIGEDFSSLYEDFKLVDHNVSSGGQRSYIEAKSSYRTEMERMVSDHWMSYDICSNTSKAAYEITLLSKKYANMYQNGNDEYNDKLAEEFGGKMAEYKNYCESNNMDWQQVCLNVSGELQIESYNYTEASKSLITNIGPVGTDFDKERIIANRAHMMVKECMDDSSADTLPLSLTGKYEYDAALDTSEHQDAKFLNKAAAWFKEKYDGIKNFVTGFHPVKSMKEAAIRTVNRIEGVDSNQFDNSALDSESVSDDSIDYS